MKGLFIGLSTLDCIYLTPNLPTQNQKLVALDQTIAAGGPATNAAVTFSYLGNECILLSVLGQHPISQLIHADLGHIHHIDLDPSCQETPSVSSIMVTESTGERAVIAINATKIQATCDYLPPNLLEGIDIVLIDGHQVAVSEAIAQEAKKNNIPVVLDGGSWKTGLDRLLPWVDYAICSANFYPPSCQTQEDVFRFLQALSIPYIAITQGEKEIIFNQGNWPPETGKIRETRGMILIPPIKAIDTLGAGDIFHGAFCHYILRNNFLDALEKASKIASHSCQFFGTRQWMNDII